MDAIAKGRKMTETYFMLVEMYRKNGYKGHVIDGTIEDIVEWGLKRIKTMTEPDWIKIAAACKATKPAEQWPIMGLQWVIMIGELGLMCKTDNADFDLDAFITLCGWRQ